MGLNTPESRKAALNNAVVWANEKIGDNDSSNGTLAFYGAVITIIVITISLWAFKLYYDISAKTTAKSENDKSAKSNPIHDQSRRQPQYDPNEQSYEPVEHAPRSEKRRHRRHRTQRPPLKNPGMMSGSDF